LFCHTINYISNPSYRKSTNSFVNKSVIVAEDASRKFLDGMLSLLNSKEGVANSDGGEEQATSIEEQGKEIRNQIGKNSVTIPGHGRVDVDGDGHYSKAENKKVPTPHVHPEETQTNPKTGEIFIKYSKDPQPATQQDIDKVRDYLELLKANGVEP
ncbi:MAG: polymorphic toxin type 24 domain-containing protein, partial [bacterium]